MILPLVLAACMDSGQACNNTTRALDAPAGCITGTTTQCAGFTIDIAAIGEITVVGPTCPTQVTCRMDSLFRCSGALEGTNCNPNGNKSVVIFKANDAPCPALPTSPAEAKKILSTGLNCKPVKKVESTFDCSATTSPCSDDESVVEVVQMEIDAGGRQILYVDHFPAEYLSTTAPTLPEGFDDIPFVTEESISSQVLRTAWDNHKPLSAVNVAAEVSSVIGVGPAITPGVHMRGVFKENCALSVDLFALAVDNDTGESVPIIEKIAFDGSNAFIGFEGNERFHAYVSDRSMREAMGLFAESTPALMDWTENPFMVPLVEGDVYTESPAYLENGEAFVDVVVTNADNNLSHVLSTVFKISVQGRYRIVETAVLGLNGHPQRILSFRDFRAVSNGSTSRPFEVKSTWYDAGGTETGSTTLKVMSARAVEPSEFTLPSPRSGKWVVHID